MGLHCIGACFGPLVHIIHPGYLNHSFHLLVGGGVCINTLILYHNLSLAYPLSHWTQFTYPAETPRRN